jgi:hypothetical protein
MWGFGAKEMSLMPVDTYFRVMTAVGMGGHVESSLGAVAMSRGRRFVKAVSGITDEEAEMIYSWPQERDEQIDE